MPPHRPCQEVTQLSLKPSAIVATAVTSPALDSPGSSHTGASCHGAWTPVDPWAASLVSPPNVGEQHPSLVLSFSEQLRTVMASTSPLPGFPPATHPGPGFQTLLCLFNTVHRRHPELMWDLQGGQKDRVGRPTPFLLCSAHAARAPALWHPPHTDDSLRS